MMRSRKGLTMAAWIAAPILVPVLVFVVTGHAQARLNAAMAEKATAFLAALTPEQKAEARFQFDDPDRVYWHFIPQDSPERRGRKGLPLKAMTPPQREVAMELLRSGLSASGYQKATTIISLEDVLRELERPPAGGDGPSRDRELYYWSIFGTPSATGTWGFSIEGHHVSLNMTVVKGELISSTPLFFGANPREVRQGPQRGLRVLAGEEDKARALVNSLDARQRSIAIVDPDPPRELLSYNFRIADPIMPRSNEGRFDPGLTAENMTPEQRTLLNALIDEYLSRMVDDVARERGRKLRDSDFNKIQFAWAGGTGKDDPHYYRVQGPTFLIEYDSTQGNGNHIHSVWRDFNGDFGLDLLAEHYRISHTH